MSLTVKPIDPAHNAIVADMEKRSGRPSYFFRMMAHRADALQHFIPLYGSIMGPGSVSQRIKELAYLATSYVNECEYCTTHHIESGAKAGISNDEMREIQTEQNQNFTPEERATVIYSRELSRNAEADSDVRDAMQAHFSAEQIVEITLVICMANFTNRFNNGLGIKPEEEVEAAG